MQLSAVVYWFLFFSKQKTAYELRSSDWSSDVCASDLRDQRLGLRPDARRPHAHRRRGRAYCRARGADPCGPDRGSSDRWCRRGPSASTRARRSEARRVGNECGGPCRSRWSPYHSTHTRTTHYMNLTHTNKTTNK